jgi:hypothetical protein
MQPALEATVSSSTRRHRAEAAAWLLALAPLLSRTFGSGEEFLSRCGIGSFVPGHPLPAAAMCGCPGCPGLEVFDLLAARALVDGCR